MKSLITLLNRLGIVPNSGATDAEIVEVERQTGLTFPNELRELYQFTNGITIDEYSLKILSLNQLLAFHQILLNANYPQLFGYLPFTDSNDSNPYCICCNEPLTGYVVLVSHDDSAKLTHRTLNTFFESLAELLAPYDSPEDWAEDGFDIEALPCDFRFVERSQKDIKRAQALGTIGYAYREPDIESRAYVERNDAFRFALTLFNGTNLDEIRQLLVFSDKYVSEAAERRLIEIGTHEASEIVATFYQDMITFLTSLRRRLESEGFTLLPDTPYRKNDINVHIGHFPRCLDGRGWYARSKSPAYEIWYQKTISHMQE